MGGKRRTIKNKFLIDEGAEPGSTVVMTEHAFVTDEAWVEMSKEESILICYLNSYIVRG